MNNNYIMKNQINSKGQVVKAPFNFSKALNLLKRGEPVRRRCWPEEVRVVYQKGYPAGIPCNKNTAEAWGIEEGSLFRCAPYLQISTGDTHVMWTPDNINLFADDWELATDKELGQCKYLR